MSVYFQNSSCCWFYVFFLQMISLENQMKKEGLLNKNHEIKEFWDFITVPENLEEVLEDGKCLI